MDERDRRAMKAVIAVFLLIVILLAILTPSVRQQMENLLENPSIREYPVSADFTLERTITISGSLNDWIIDFPEPESISDTAGNYVQEIKSINYNPQPTSTETRYGTPWLTWQGGPLSGTTTITVIYKVYSKTMVWDVTSKDSGRVSDIPQDLKNKYLGDEWKIRPSDPQIKALSKQIVGNDPNPNVYDATKAIYDWMLDNLTYKTGSSGEPQDCVETLKNRYGDCDDQSILFASLARAAGIPAWLKFGALYDSMAGHWGGHGWLLFYMPLNAGNSGTVAVDVVNKEYLVRDCFRFSEWESDGNGTHLKDYYYTFNAHLSGATQPQFSDSYDSISLQESPEKVRVYGEHSTPGFDISPFVISVMASISLMAVIKRRRR